MLQSYSLCRSLCMHKATVQRHKRPIIHPSIYYDLARPPRSESTPRYRSTATKCHHKHPASAELFKLESAWKEKEINSSPRMSGLHVRPPALPARSVCASGGLGTAPRHGAVPAGTHSGTLLPSDSCLCDFSRVGAFTLVRTGRESKDTVSRRVKVSVYQCQ